ncbi:MAG: DUF1573 domain-containing protein [Spirochaetales bacterium]|nr:DUF1573 domain-containing protein [Spirochaetales bacterium]
MRNKVFPIILLVFIIIAVLCSCMGPAKSPGIHFESDIYDYGIIEEGKSVHHTFEFTNNGTATLIIKEVHPTCGCTVAGDYDKKVEPGQKGKIPITLNTSGFEGYLAKTVKVKTNIPDKIDYFILTLTGTVKVSIDVKPRKLEFGNIERDRTSPLEGTISIVNRLPDPFKITDVINITNDVPVPNVTVSNENVETKIETYKDGFVYSLIITVKPPFKHGQVMGIIRVKTDSTIIPEINTQFSYSMEPLVKVFPNPLFVSKDQIKNGEEQFLNILCEPGYDMQVVDLSVNFEEVKVSLEEGEKGRKYTIVLKFPKNFKFDPNNTLVVKFKAQNVPDEPIFGIPVLLM